MALTFVLDVDDKGTAKVRRFEGNLNKLRGRMDAAKLSSSGLSR